MAQPLEDVLLGAYEAPDEIPETDEEQAPLRERFRITSDDQADWAVRKIAQARRDLAKAETLAEAEIARVTAWLDGQRKDAMRTVGFFEALLREHYLPRFASDPRLKTIKLPAGRVQVRAQQPEFQRDEAALLAWLKKREMTEYIERIERPRWGELKQHVRVIDDLGLCIDAVTSEIVEGVTVIPRPPAFRVVTEEANEDAVR